MAERKIRVLDTLLRVRRNEEERRARDAALARQTLAAAESTRLGIQQAQTDALNEAGRRISQPEFDTSDVRAYYQYERHLAKSLDACDADIRELGRALAMRQQVLLEAAARRRMIEVLRDRRLAERAQRLRKLEQQASDEVAVARARIERLRGESGAGGNSQP
jgi:flagellar export protein FliJ